MHKPARKQGRYTQLACYALAHARAFATTTANERVNRTLAYARGCAFGRSFPPLLCANRPTVSRRDRVPVCGFRGWRSIPRGFLLAPFLVFVPLRKALPLRPTLARFSTRLISTSLVPAIFNKLVASNVPLAPPPMIVIRFIEKCLKHLCRLKRLCCLKRICV
jgi:hypothetical protein